MLQHCHSGFYCFDVFRLMVEIDRPVLEFDGELLYVDNKDTLDKVCEDVMSDPQLTVLGLDTEWPVTYRPGCQAKTAVLQMCSLTKCYVIHLSTIQSIPPSLLRVLVATRIVKVGLNIEGDIWKLGVDYGIPAQHINRQCK